MSNYDDCDCRDCVLSRAYPTCYYPCKKLRKNKKYEPEQPDCYCDGCRKSRQYPNFYIPCVSVSNRPVPPMPKISIDDVPLPHTRGEKKSGDVSGLFDIMKNISSIKHDSVDTRTKASFNKNLDKAIQYIMKAINR